MWISYVISHPVRPFLLLKIRTSQSWPTEAPITNLHTRAHYCKIFFAFCGVPLILKISASSSMPQVHDHGNHLLDSSLFDLYKIVI